MSHSRFAHRVARLISIGWATPRVAPTLVLCKVKITVLDPTLSVPPACPVRGGLSTNRPGKHWDCEKFFQVENPNLSGE